MSGSIYAGIHPAANTPRKYYKGVWRGKEVMVEKEFRTHTFSDAECAALCNGEMLELHDLVRDKVRYAVIGSLREAGYAAANGIPIVKFKQDRTISVNPEYSFEKRHAAGHQDYVINMVVKPYNDGATDENVNTAALDEGKIKRIGESNVSADEAFIQNFSLESLSPEEAEIDARMQALMSEPAVPMIFRISHQDSYPVFRHVVSLLTDEELTMIAQRAQVLQESDA